RYLLTGLNQIRIRVKTTMIISLSTNYADVPTGKPLALIGSGDTLEISINQGNASQQLGFGLGDKITISFN
ncbi:SAM-dependent chlorinase/fluorinase, partial [bacterium]|nr:SAM-dependent chlorinase/fluorinase [bacterium]